MFTVKRLRYIFSCAGFDGSLRRFNRESAFSREKITSRYLIFKLYLFDLTLTHEKRFLNMKP